MNWYKKADSMDPTEWGILFEKLKKELGHIPTNKDMYDAKADNIFRTVHDEKYKPINTFIRYNFSIYCTAWTNNRSIKSWK